MTLQPRKRLLVVSVSLFVFFSLLILQFYRLQVLEGEKWKKIAKSQHEKVIREPFKRGRFFSNVEVKDGHLEKEQPFVVDVPKFHLYIDPSLIHTEDAHVMSAELAKVLHLEGVKKQELQAHFAKKARSRRLALFVDGDVQLQLQKWWRGFAKKRKLPMNALYFLKEYKRSYPFGSLLGQVLHTIRDDRDIVNGQWIPTGGLELSFDRYLRGVDGKKVIQRSPSQEFETDRVFQAPIHGADVYLTINHCLQAICEEEIERGVQKVHAKAGWVVMMQPHTGEIYAVAQYPFFEPGKYRDYFNHSELIESTRLKAINDCFEPGSTMKAISCAIALMANDELAKRGEAPLFDPDEMMRTDNNAFPGRQKPLVDVRTHRCLDMYMSLQKSSNVYVARLMQRVVERLGNNWYRDKLVNTFGFGLKSGIELLYENPGMVPTPGKTYPGGALQWSLPTPYSLAMGYNLMVNSLQMLRSFAVFANGGYLVKPRLIKKVVREHTPSVKELCFCSCLSKERVLSEEISSRVVKGLKYVTKPGGAAPVADVFGFTEAGKTSTTEKLFGGVYSKRAHFTSFIGFAPAENAELIMIVCVDEPESRYIPGLGTTRYGGKSAAPIFTEIARRSLQYLGVEPDDPKGYSRRDPRSNIEEADWMEEVKQLKVKYEKWN
jgi:cell division protein FtsI (penicillin-binding protein 3)